MISSKAKSKKSTTN